MILQKAVVVGNLKVIRHVIGDYSNGKSIIHVAINSVVDALALQSITITVPLKFLALYNLIRSFRTSATQMTIIHNNNNPQTT